MTVSSATHCVGLEDGIEVVGTEVGVELGELGDDVGDDVGWGDGD